MKWGLVAVTGAAAVLRLHPLFANAFHADEALFASWARLIAVWRDPLLLTQAVDKPPLLFYLQALFYPLQGPVAWAARLPNWIASLLLVPLVGAVAWRLWRDEWTAVLAAAFVALSPLHVQFSATAFTDPLLTTLLFAAWAGVAQGRTQGSGGAEGRRGGGEPSTENGPRNTDHGIRITEYGPRTTDYRLPNTDYRLLTAGILFGLAVATKHQAWLFVPLVGTTAVCRGWGRRQWRRWLAGAVPVVLLLVAWTAVRTGELTLWTAQMQNFGGLRLAWSWELWPRLQSWLALWRWVLPGGGVLVLVAVVYWVLVFGNWVIDHWPVALTGLFITFYALLHYVLAVPVWDRYLLPLVPLLALPAARGTSSVMRYAAGGRWRVAGRNTEHGTRNTEHRLPITDYRLPITLLLFLILLPAAWDARNGRYPIGGQPTADQGAAQVAEVLADAPYGTVLYDHWYSWQWRYHLFDKRVFVSWFPHPQALAADLIAFGNDGNPRYLALPDGAAAQPVIRTVQTAGFHLQPVPIPGDSGIILYRIR